MDVEAAPAGMSSAACADHDGNHDRDLDLQGRKRLMLGRITASPVADGHLTCRRGHRRRAQLLPRPAGRGARVQTQATMPGRNQRIERGGGEIGRTHESDAHCHPNWGAPPTPGICAKMKRQCPVRVSERGGSAGAVAFELFHLARDHAPAHRREIIDEEPPDGRSRVDAGGPEAGEMFFSSVPPSAWSSASSPRQGGSPRHTGREGEVAFLVDIRLVRGPDDLD